MYNVQLESRYYVAGHTAKGFVNYVRSNLDGIEHVIILKHPAKIIKTKIVQAWIKKYRASKMEILSSSFNQAYLDGVIIREKKMAILTDDVDTADIPHAITIDVTEHIDDPTSSKDMVYLEAIISSSYQAAYRCFAKGLTFHEQLEAVYINEMDFDKADTLAEVFMEELFSEKEEGSQGGKVTERLFGTNTSDGIVNHLAALIAPFENRFFIKGRAGTGKSFFMKKVLSACLEKGYDVERYHCSFDPTSIDMIIIRALDCCLFDSTAPHELFPQRKNDGIIDLYEKTVNPFTDERHAVVIHDLMTQYKKEMKQGLLLLQNTKKINRMQDQLWSHVTESDIDSYQHTIEKFLL